MRHCDRSALRPPGVGPVYEVADVLAGARAFGEVLVNVNLLEAVSDRIVLLEKPPKELASLGDLLLRGQSRRAHVFGASVDLLAEVLQMVPARTHTPLWNRSASLPHRSQTRRVVIAAQCRQICSPAGERPGNIRSSASFAFRLHFMQSRGEKALIRCACASGNVHRTSAPHSPDQPACRARKPGQMSDRGVFEVSPVSTLIALFAIRVTSY